jgi:hypothetical protein
MRQVHVCVNLLSGGASQCMHARLCVLIAFALPLQIGQPQACLRCASLIQGAG